jgi:acetyltransferase
MEITTVDVLDAALQAELTTLLSDCVKSGASVGFVVPVAPGALEACWEATAMAVQGGTQILLIARDARALVGTVQLALPQKANARHRAEVQRLLVPPASRRRGIGRRLMKAAEQAALERGRTLLVWDTIVGTAGDHLYASMGYIRAGVIPEYALSSDGAKLEPTVYFYALLSDNELTLPAPAVVPVAAPVARPTAFSFSGSIERYGRSEPLEIVIEKPVPAEAGAFVCVVHAATLGLSGMRILGAEPGQAADLALELVKQSTDGNPILTADGAPIELESWTIGSSG